MARILFYDVETTGLDKNKHSIIQLSAILDQDGEEIDRLDLEIQPHPKALIEESALQANGHRREDFPNYLEFKEAFRIFKTFLKTYVDPYDRKDKIHLAGFRNASFDDGFLRKYFELCSDKSFGSFFWSDSIDVSSKASDHLKEVRETMPSFKLHRVAKTLGMEVDDDNLHDSMYDTELTRGVYWLIEDELNLL